MTSRSGPSNHVGEATRTTSASSSGRPARPDAWTTVASARKALAIPDPGSIAAYRARDVLRSLQEIADPARLDGMARYGIDTRSAIGVTVTELRRLARGIGTDHHLAAALWASGIHEALILASLVDDPARVTEAQMDAWVADLDSWDVCDGVCGNLFDRTQFALDKAVVWIGREPEFERRAGFALMAWSAVHRKDLPDRSFAALLPAIRERSTDDRTYVKKAVSWALRSIGKRSAGLYAKAIRTAEQIGRIDARAARWVSSDVLRELRGDAVQARLKR